MKTEFRCGKDDIGGHQMCISLDAVCDGTNDCGDWSDEISDYCNNITSNNVNGCHLDNGGCDQVLSSTRSQPTSKLSFILFLDLY